MLCFALCPTLAQSHFLGRPTSSSCRVTTHLSTCRRPFRRVVVRALEPGPRDPKQDPTAGPFGIKLKTNGDVLKFGLAAIGVGYAMKAFIQLLGVPDLAAGQWTTGILSVATLLGWVSTYVFRVGTKSMTYAQQLRDYEDAVIEKRYNELSEEELRALSEELEEDL